MKVKKVSLPLFLMQLPLSGGDYDDLFLAMVFVAIFTLILVIVYLMVGEEREETET